jgi:hypothetical protein
VITLDKKKQLFELTWPIFLEAVLFSVIGSVSILYILFGSQTPDEAKVFPIISIVVGTLLTVFVIHIVFRIVSLHFAMQAEILNNTKISTKLLTYIASQK